MTNTAVDYWSINGTSLNQYCWNITTFGGNPRGLPALRGSEAIYAYRPGQEFRAKVAEARTISLDMMISGVDPEDEDRIADMTQFQTNLAALRQLLWTPNSQVELTRRWTVYEGGVATQRTATALAQVAGTLDPEMRGNHGATLTVEMQLSDPYFYSNTLTTTELVPGTPLTLVNSGDDLIRDAIITIIGPTASGLDPVVQVAAEDADGNSQWVRYRGKTEAEYMVRLFCAKSVALSTLSPTSTVTPVPAPAPVSGKVQHYGRPGWLEIAQGSNIITTTVGGTYGTGDSYIDISYRIPYV